MDIRNKILFFGTFNPTQNGHLEIAEKVEKATNSKGVIFVVAHSPYHKNSCHVKSIDRIKIAKLATQFKKGFEVSDIEYRLNNPKSYTIDTVKALINEQNSPLKGKVKLLIGADAFEGLKSWYKASELAKLVDFVVVSRPGSKNIDEIAKKLNIVDLTYQSVKVHNPISSSQVRDCVKKGQDISSLVPKAVKDFILKHRFYK